MSITTDNDLMTEPGEGTALWFLGTRVVVRNPQSSPELPLILEMTVPSGGAAPWHRHETLDEMAFLLGGEIVVRCGDDTFAAQAGCYLSLPAGVPHTFRVTSSDPARLLLIQSDRTFLDFVEAVSEPARAAGLPSEPASVNHETLLAAATTHHQQILGPPITDADAQGVAASLR
jgi:quercetin dioxygenase-like cupin family protein